MVKPMPIKKLSDQEKQEIMNLHGTKNARDIANDFGISFKTVYNIWNSKPKETNSNTMVYVGIIKKMIPEFAKNGLKVTFDKEEVPIVKELIKEVMS